MNQLIKPIAYFSLLGVGLSLFGQADKIHAKYSSIPARWSELTGTAVFLAGIALIIGTWGRYLVGWVRGLVGRLARVKVLEERLGELQAEITRQGQEPCDRLRARGVALASVWTTKSFPRPRPTFLHRDDPIYGQLGIHRKLFPILCNPLVQRLNYVRQLSFAYLTFPSASHTRLSHLLGVAKNAQEVLRKMLTRRLAYKYRRKDPNTKLRRLEPDLVAFGVSDEDMEKIMLKAQLCALLHDVGHGPFGHALDKLVPYLGKQTEQSGTTQPPDIVYSVEYIKAHLRAEINEAGFEPEEIAAILNKTQKKDLQGWDVLIADLIASTVDIDRIDYLVRDAHMTGLQMGYLNTEALREQMYPMREGKDYKLVYAPAALTEMEDLAQAHHNMYIHCYEHRRKLAAERLLMRAVQYMFDNGMQKNDLMLLSDDQLFAIMSEFLHPDSIEGKRFRALQHNVHFAQATAYHLSLWTWNLKTSSMELRCNPDLSLKVQAWHDGWTQGKSDALKGLYVEDPDSWEKRICQAARLAEEDWWKVIVTVPGFDTKLNMESGAFVVREDVSGFFLDDFYHASAVLKNILTALVPERQVVRALVADDPGSAEVAKIREAADELFKGQP